MLKILILCDLTREPMRIRLQGLLEYARKHGGCKLYPVSGQIAEDPSKAHEIIERAKSLEVDAIFGRWPGIDIKLAKSLGIPVVLVTVDKEYPDFPMLSGNYAEIGKVAADYFIRNGYKSFAYFGGKNLLWSRERRKGFKNSLDPTAPFSMYEFEQVDKEWDSIGKWLKELPKATAIYVCSDMYASILTEISYDFKVNIPLDVAILGTDDDEFLCNISTPTISSLRLDFHRQGRELCQLLLSMVEKGEMWSERILIRPIAVIERESAKRYNINDPIVLEIVSLIENNYATIRSVDDIITDIPLTRRSIELRFKKQMSPDTINNFLARVRINNMRKILEENKEISIAEAGGLVGLPDPFYLCKIFKKYTGMTPSAYRKSLSK